MSLPAFAGETKRLGAGVNLGDPLGVSIRFYLIDRLSLDFIAGKGLLEDLPGGHYAILQPSLLFHLRNIMDYDAPNFSVVPWIGFGIRIAVFPVDDVKATVARIPLGVNFLFKKGTYEASLEFAPTVNLIDSVGNHLVGVSGGIGLRYFFF